MRKVLLLTLALILVLGSGFSSGTAYARTPKILEFDSMIGVPRPYTGSTNAIRGLPGGGLPWVVSSATGELSTTGRLEIKLLGLVFDPNDPTVIERGLAGINTVPNFKAVVSCLSRDEAGNPTTVNVSTGLFPADSTGNSTIEAQLSLPAPCIAPIIFVTSPAGAWFAATGQ